MADKSRVQFDFTESALAELDGLKAKLKVNTRAEVIRYSLRLMRWVLEQITSGGRILVERDGQVHSVVFPFLDEVVGEKTQKEQAARPLVAAG